MIDITVNQAIRDKFVAIDAEILPHHPGSLTIPMLVAFKNSMGASFIIKMAYDVYLQRSVVPNDFWLGHYNFSCVDLIAPPEFARMMMIIETADTAIKKIIGE